MQFGNCEILTDRVNGIICGELLEVERRTGSRSEEGDGGLESLTSIDARGARSGVAQYGGMEESEDNKSLHGRQLKRYLACAERINLLRAWKF